MMMAESGIELRLTEIEGMREREIMHYNLQLLEKKRKKEKASS